MRGRGGVLHIAIVVIFCFSLEANLYSDSSSSSRSVKKACLLSMKVLGKFSRLVKVGLITAVVANPLLHEVNARIEKSEHIGAGIYLNTTDLENHLSFMEIEILQSKVHDENWEAKVIQLFAKKLYGDYEEDLARWWTVAGAKKMLAPQPRSVVSYFEGESSERGVCRTKALILTSILRHYGIEAHCETGLHGKIPHSWVRIGDEVIDPTNSPYLQDPESFYRENDIRYIFPTTTYLARLGALVR